MEYIIIHGELNRKWQLSEELKRRCDYALVAAPQNNSVIVCCTGGTFSKEQEGIPVSVAMRRYLKNSNIHLRVFVEGHSLTTIDNVEKLIPKLLPSDKITVITSTYHVPRTKLIWSLLGRKLHVVVKGAPSKLTFLKFATEVAAIAITLLYAFHFKGLELWFRKKHRNI